MSLHFANSSAYANVAELWKHVVTRHNYDKDEEHFRPTTEMYDIFNSNDWKKEHPITIVVFNRVFLPPNKLLEHYVSRYQPSHYGPFLIHVAESSMHCVTADSLYTTNFLVWTDTSLE